MECCRLRSEMNDRTAIGRVARLVGIEPSYRDALGQTRRVSDDTLLALIGAFGLPVDPAPALDVLAEEERRAPLGVGPVHFVRAEAVHPALVLRLPDDCREISWSCRLENGERRSGQPVMVSGRGGERFSMPLPAGLPIGYHRLDLAAGGVMAQLCLIVAPARCHLPVELGPGARSWGLTCQLYGLRSARNWGMGDFTDLAMFARATGSCAAVTLGVNPLHALFAAEPLHISPYSPSSRIWLDYLYIDVTAVPGFSDDKTAHAVVESSWFGLTRATARSSEVIDYGAVAACKRPVLEALFRRFKMHDLGGDCTATSHLGQAFRDFQRCSGRSLADFAVFEALDEQYRRDNQTLGWHSWPLSMRNPRSPEVADFANTNRDRIEFFQFLQWEADRQLAAAAVAGREAGLSLGLYRDLAVGVDPNGAEAWADPELVAPGAAIGAPPDAFNRAGQNWGLAPVSPLVLRRQGFAPFIASLRANMRHAGILRIDHVMSLNRLFWIPSGMDATLGAYVSYPFDNLLRLVALESQRNGCAVIGEDLGTVPPGFRETMQSADILSYRVLAFERRQDGGFVPPAEYPALAAASAATHDLATLKGFWLGNDLAWRRRLDLYPDAEAAEIDADQRHRDRYLLLEALVAAGLLTPERLTQFLSDSGEPIFTTELRDAILTYLARSCGRLMLVQTEDVSGEEEQANLPGTTDAHPNWRRRLTRTLDEIAGGSDLQRVARLCAEGRRRSPRRSTGA